MQLVFIELPKFKAKNFPERKLQILWLRFMAELNEKSNQVPSEWLTVPEIKQALDLAEEAAYTPEELAAYDQYWDAISIEKSLVADARQQGEKQAKLTMAKKLLSKGYPLEEIVSLTETELTVREIEAL